MTSGTTEKWKQVKPQIDVVFPLFMCAFYSASVSSLVVMVISYLSLHVSGPASKTISVS